MRKKERNVTSTNLVVVLNFQILTQNKKFSKYWEGVAKVIYPIVISHESFNEIPETNTKYQGINFCKPFDGLARQV